MTKILLAPLALTLMTAAASAQQRTCSCREAARHTRCPLCADSEQIPQRSE